MMADIRQRLDQISTEENATLLLAVESGSRAWGFHSEDSDYDVRFIYARPVEWHLSVAPGRDVIERPISDALDLSGWDLRKTLGLMLGSNAVVLEWLQSPIRYIDTPGFREDLRDFGQQVLRRKPVMWHYLRLAERQLSGLRDDAGHLRLKRYFYTIRPVLALRWLRLHAEPMPPMDMASLMAETDLSADIVAQIDGLIARKKVAEASVTAESCALLDSVIETELDAARSVLTDGKPEPKPALSSLADALHVTWTRRAVPGGELAS